MLTDPSLAYADHVRNHGQRPKADAVIERQHAVIAVKRVAVCPLNIVLLVNPSARDLHQHAPDALATVRGLHVHAERASVRGDWRASHDHVAANLAIVHVRPDHLILMPQRRAVFAEQRVHRLRLHEPKSAIAVLCVFAAQMIDQRGRVLRYERNDHFPPP